MGIYSGLENLSVIPIIYIKIYTLGTALKTLSSQFPVFCSGYTSCLTTTFCPGIYLHWSASSSRKMFMLLFPRMLFFPLLYSLV